VRVGQFEPNIEVFYGSGFCHILPPEWDC
jgi:hypothetical protein